MSEMCQHITGVYYEEEFTGVYDTVMSLADYHHSELMIHSKTSGLSSPADKKTLKTQEDIGERGNLSHVVYTPTPPHEDSTAFVICYCIHVRRLLSDVEIYIYPVGS